MTADGKEARSDAPADAGVKPWARLSEVFHPFHPDVDNENAFAHALKIAAISGARLSLMSLQPSDASRRSRPDEPWATLSRWSRISEAEIKGTERLVVQHLQTTGEDPVKACMGYLRTNPTDLVVLGTRLQHGRATWLSRSAAENLAAKAGEMTLFIPQGVKGFVAWNDGTVHLDSILITVGSEPRPEPAIEAARRLMLSMPESTGVVTLMHVGDPAELPDFRLPDVPGWTWKAVSRQGNVVETILSCAEESNAGLIVMTTSGRHGFLDVLRGAVSEHVLREACCPLLAMPAGSFLG